MDLDAPIQTIKDRFENRYGVRITARDCFSYAIRHAGYIDRISMTEVLRFNEIYPMRKTYTIRERDRDLLLKMLEQTQSNHINYKTLLSYLVIAVAYRDELYNPTFAPKNVEVKPKRLSSSVVDDYYFLEKI